MTILHYIFSFAVEQIQALDINFAREVIINHNNQ